MKIPTIKINPHEITSIFVEYESISELQDWSVLWKLDGFLQSKLLTPDDSYAISFDKGAFQEG